MTIVCHGRRKKRKLRRKTLDRSNQGSNFLGDSFSNRENVRAPVCLEEKGKPNILKDEFSSRTDASIFVSVAPVLLDLSHETSWVFPAFKSADHYLPRATVSLSVGLTQVQKPTLVVATEQMPDHRIFLKLGFIPCKAKQPLRDMELQGKEEKRLKDTGHLFRKNQQLKGVCWL